MKNKIFKEEKMNLIEMSMRLTKEESTPLEVMPLWKIILLENFHQKKNTKQREKNCLKKKEGEDLKGEEVVKLAELVEVVKLADKLKIEIIKERWNDPSLQIIMENL